MADEIISLEDLTADPVEAPVDESMITDISTKGAGNGLEDPLEMPNQNPNLNKNNTPKTGTALDVIGSSNPYFDPNTDEVLEAEDLYMSPVERLSGADIDLIDKLGNGPDSKPGKPRPILDVQNVDNYLRLATQLLFDNADEKAAFLERQLGKGYVFGQDPLDSTDVILKRKGTRYWGRVDPSADRDTLLQEVAENIDGIAQALAIPPGALAGAVATGTIEGVRQLVKKYADPESDTSWTGIGIATASGAAAGKVSAVLNAAKQAGVDGAKIALEASGKSAPNAFGKLKQAAKFFERPQYVAQNLGADAADFARGIEDDIGYLFANFPEAKIAIQEPFTLKGKKEAIENLVKKTGEGLDAFYSNPEPIVKVKDILASDQAALLEQAIKSSRVQKGQKLTVVDEVTRRKADSIQRDLLTRVATVALPEKSASLHAFKHKKLLTAFPELKQMGFKTDNEAMAALLQDVSITPAEARAIHDGFASKLKFGKQKGQIRDLDTVYKYALDSLTSGITKAAEATGDTTLISNNKLFNKLAPVRDVIDRSVNSDKASPFNFTKYVPGALNGIRRQSLMIATKLSARPEVRAGLNKLGGDSFPYAKIDMNGPSVGKVLSKGMRGLGFLEAKSLGKHQFLSRNSEDYFNDPQMINALTQQIGDLELTDALVRQVDRGDKEMFANTLSMAAAGNPDLFEMSPYPSLVTQNGKPVLMDKYDREQHRQYIEKHVIDPQERYEQLKALNFTGEMVKAPFEIPKQEGKRVRVTNTAKGSTVSRVAQSLRDTETVTLDDGSERQDYDY